MAGRPRARRDARSLGPRAGAKHVPRGDAACRHRAGAVIFSARNRHAARGFPSGPVFLSTFPAGASAPKGQTGGIPPPGVPGTPLPHRPVRYPAGCGPRIPASRGRTVRTTPPSDGAGTGPSVRAVARAGISPRAATAPGPVSAAETAANARTRVAHGSPPVRIGHSTRVYKSYYCPSRTQRVRC